LTIFRPLDRSFYCTNVQNDALGAHPLRLRGSKYVLAEHPVENHLQINLRAMLAKRTIF